jgi:hypothetical protein
VIIGAEQNGFLNVQGGCGQRLDQEGAGQPALTGSRGRPGIQGRPRVDSGTKRGQIYFSRRRREK